MAKKRERFDPRIGAYAAENWWQLGRGIQLAQEQPDALAAVCEDVTRRLREDDYSPEEIQRLDLTAKRLGEFYRTTYELLEAKFKGRPIRWRFTELVQDHPPTYKDDGQYFNLSEDRNSFWAFEFEAVLSELGKPAKSKGWLAAVATCTCGKFFVKSRSNQQHHSEACRLRSANRASYRRRKHR
jgi:hypothetical protein